MNVMDMLRRSGGLEAVSQQLGIPPAMAAAGAEALLPSILGGFRKQSEAGGGGDIGLGALIGALGGLGGGGLAANVLGPDETDVSKGNDVLGQIFGSKDVSRTVADHAGAQAGIDPAILKKMLPLLAMLVGGYLSARASGSGTESSSSGGLGSILGGILGNTTGSVGSGAGGGLAGGLGGLGSLIDLNGDGNPLDDIINMAGKLTR